MSVGQTPGHFHLLSKLRFGPRMRLAAVCLLTLAAMGIAVMLLMIFVASTGQRNMLVGLTLAAAPVPFYVAIILWLDRFEAEPLWMLLVCFIWGSTAAAIISLYLNEEAAIYLSHTKWHEHGRMLAMMLAAPAIEELAKGLILLMLFSWNRHEFDGVLDGIIYAAITGLGFAMSENVLYYGQALLEQGTHGLTSTVLLRGLIFPFQHPFFTSFIGIGLGWSAVTRHAWVRRLAPAGGLMMAIALHVLWNMSTVHKHYFVAGYLLVSVPVMLGILALIYLSLRSESHIIAVHLQMEVTQGRMTPQEYRRLSRMKRRMMHAIRCFFKQNYRVCWQSICFHQAATELAFFRHHVATGRLEVDAQMEQAYLQRIEKLRQVTADAS